ncbi:MAG: HEAT repeat domain-containing protein [Humidesulfovibrio sp.]|nr:HEAT repeat domain-containing protein [Humidesulfovibrio sp.]
MARFRDLKEKLRGLFAAPNLRARLDELDAFPARHLPGPLFSLLLDRDELVRWRAVEAFGRAVARMAGGVGEGEGLEAARVVVRQCLWRMNEESGGLGWGIPEALGETLARHERLAGEFHRVLASYVREEVRGEGNYLEHPGLRRGVYWALSRLAESFPELLAGEVGTLRAGLADEDRGNAGLAARALGLLPPAWTRQARAEVAALADDPAVVPLFLNGELTHSTTGALARQALARMDADNGRGK